MKELKKMNKSSPIVDKQTSQEGTSHCLSNGHKEQTTTRQPTISPPKQNSMREWIDLVCIVLIGLFLLCVVGFCLFLFLLFSIASLGCFVSLLVSFLLFVEFLQCKKQ